MNVNVAIRQAIERNFDQPTRFLLAVSGGPDSQALLKSFPHVAKAMGHAVAAAGVDHGLRPEAKDELDLAQELARSTGVPFTRLRIHVRPGPNLMARARDERYKILSTTMSGWGSGYIVTAHHMDDRAETVLIRILRGRGAASLGVLMEKSHHTSPGHPGISRAMFRPMLQVRRTDVLGYLGRWRVPYATDPSNSDERYLRAWVRKRLMPLMLERSPDVVSKLCLIADDLLASPDAIHDVEPEGDIVTSILDVFKDPDGKDVESVFDRTDELIAESVHSV